MYPAAQSHGLHKSLQSLNFLTGLISLYVEAGGKFWIQLILQLRILDEIIFFRQTFDIWLRNNLECSMQIINKYVYDGSK